MSNVPFVSVLMSVHNGEKFLAKAIESILVQSLTDFEFIIINDGSTDKSPSILDKYKKTDKRIRVYHQQHRGLVHSLNLGIHLVRSDYIARADCDDINYPYRLERQVEYFLENPLCSVVAGKVELVDYEGKHIGYWESDFSNTTWDDIRKYLPRSNCIAHPSVMIKTSIAKQYLYNPTQLNSEDYDLWLRLCSSNKVIEKVDNVVMQYRIHPNSATNIDNLLVGEQTRNIRTKIIFIKNKLSTGKITKFDIIVLMYTGRDLLNYLFHSS